MSNIYVGWMSTSSRLPWPSCRPTPRPRPRSPRSRTRSGPSPTGAILHGHRPLPDPHQARDPAEARSLRCRPVGPPFPGRGTHLRSGAHARTGGAPRPGPLPRDRPAGAAQVQALPAQVPDPSGARLLSRQALDPGPPRLAGGAGPCLLPAHLRRPAGLPGVLGPLPVQAGSPARPRPGDRHPSDRPVGRPGSRPAPVLPSLMRALSA